MMVLVNSNDEKIVLLIDCQIISLARSAWCAVPDRLSKKIHVTGQVWQNLPVPIQINCTGCSASSLSEEVRSCHHRSPVSDTTCQTKTTNSGKLRAESVMGGNRGTVEPKCFR